MLLLWWGVGQNGDIYIWKIGVKQHSLIGTLKEHHQEVAQIRFSDDGNEFVSAAHDGSIMICNTNPRVNCIRFMAQTFFNAPDFYNKTGILITVWFDKRIVLWDSFNASLIRELESSLNAQPNSIHILPNGSFFVTGGDDKLLKVWDFQTGGIIAIGRVHYRNIRKV
jgi:WD40 repeat protein